ncbi:MAG TPA: helix-turn-helix transcriptional regulator [Acidimicrobiales bacterium]|nr:helix-turn-helix transcriptional regulator [Acidimicrobiales bacterium]
MAKPKRDQPSQTWSASQVVAHNLTRARELRGLTQAEVAERLSRFSGARWSQVTVAQAEGSVSGQRVRSFSANELVALARTFDLPVLYFFLPPDDEHRTFAAADSPAKGWPWEYLLLLVWGHRQNFSAVAERAAPWAHASTILTVPKDDVLDGRPGDRVLADLVRQRERFTPEDMLAVAFNGLARRRMRGSLRPGEEVASLAANLRGLADALEAFDNYRPGTFFDAEELRRIGDGPDDRDETDGEDEV